MTRDGAGAPLARWLPNSQSGRVGQVAGSPPHLAELELPQVEPVFDLPLRWDEPQGICHARDGSDSASPQVTSR